MTPEEKKAAKKTAQIIRAARKQQALTQIDLSHQLGISQSAISKMEAGILIPSVYQWFELCKVMHIPTDSHILGYLDYLRPVSISDSTFEGGFRIPKQYSRARGSSVRSLRPFVKWAEQKMGEKKYQSALKEFGIDPDFFIEYTHQISIKFAVDFVSWMMSKNILRMDEIKSLVQPVNRGESHGGLQNQYDRAKNVADLMTSVFGRAPYYEKNFKYVIEDQSKTRIDFLVVPEDHVIDDLRSWTPGFSAFLSEYRKAYFSRLTHFDSLRGATIEEVGGKSQGLERATYRLAWENDVCA